MANVFEGEPDGRQSDKREIPPSRFRPVYRALTVQEKVLHDDIKAKAVELELLFSEIKPNRYTSLALIDLESSVMWVIKGLTL